MKEHILKIAYNLENNIIDENKAKLLLLNLFGVNSNNLTNEHISKLLKNISKETWLYLNCSEDEWKKWWNNRNKLNLNINK